MRELLPVQGESDGALTGQWLSADGRELHFGYRDGFSQPALNCDKCFSFYKIVERRGADG